MCSNAIVSNICPNMMQCTDCENACRVISTGVMLSNFLLIEVSPSIISKIQFESKITIKKKMFQLSALVRNNGSHFTCAVMERNGNIFGWKYIDDLQTNIKSCVYLHELFQSNSLGWYHCWFS